MFAMFIYFCFFVCLFVCFNFLTVHHKKFTLSDFHQEVAFNQYFYLYQEFMFLCAFLSICLSVFGVQITPELMNRSL